MVVSGQEEPADEVSADVVQMNDRGDVTPQGPGPVPVDGFRPMRAPSLPFVLAAIAVVAVVVILSMAASALVVFAFGAAIAYLSTPVVDWLERQGMRRFLAVIAVVAAVIVSLLLAALALVYVLITQGANFLHALPTILQSISDQYDQAEFPGWLRDAIDGVVTAIAASLSGLSPTTVALGVLNGALAIAGLFGSLLLLPFFMLYVLNDQPEMKRSFYRGIPEPWKADVNR